MPKGYIIGNISLRDADAYKPYSLRNDEIVPRHGGKFLARGGRSQILEGDSHDRQVIIEFPSYEDALAFYNDPDYQENMKIRQANADGSILVVEGV
ncbi:DUF1330 domain-containing protein [Roseobacter denitrificans]|uniref:DUF1330 domain-containing protein n=1 Tax=Roseobacter denitrificans (strain ATCC 33942 / OCh 114) TaxID=375451 RepID=Q16DN6_ROSDO|nr:DUF1330 domain-containing protein [Roseobacter denitrificans]ABG29907.1 conserved hypothetical protein [Roseobacter denitrificans OCh 114]AVL53120.1 DUF1330 domain-containing protein [Roseobacter denitrificans]SFG37994.1 Uncharacterized conserved protein, DUF1330 family [Roseobacter denitrificans OCh 114]